MPSVQAVLRALKRSELPPALVTNIVRETLGALRADSGVANAQEAIAQAQAAVDLEERRGIASVINATGVILHTNLGRAPLCEQAVQAVTEAARGYSTLEYDVTAGVRGRRGAHVERCLAMLAGADAALVVNNCAAALVLLLQHFCVPGRRDVVISRGELVQIGGGFRVPEILKAARARLCEVGTTNQTSVADYEAALTPRTAMLLRVHRSNFFIDGFASSPTRQELAAIAKSAGVPFVEDLGSGAIGPLPMQTRGIEEPSPMLAHKEGATLTCFSGDKLFGGPQAGIITGPRAHIEALRREPLYRALRPDKLTLAAMQATAEIYLRGQQETDIPILHMMREPLENVRARASALLERLAFLPLKASIVETTACVGGGSLPQVQLPSAAIALRCEGLSEEELATRLRLSRPSVIGVVAHGEVRLDLRTVFAAQEDPLIRAIAAALTGGNP